MAMMKSLPLTSLAIVFVSSLHVASAQTASRAWVASTGTDQPSCGSVTSPCRTPQYAHDNVVAAGGEIDFLNPAGYGTINITKAISLVNDGVGTTGMLAPAGGNAITINAGPNDAIQLRGLTIEGAGVGVNGIVFNSGGSLIVTNSTVQNFVRNSTSGSGCGIFMQPTSGSISFTISNTLVSNNAVTGILYQPPSGSATANGDIDRVVATANGDGIEIFTGLPGGGATIVTISNTTVSNNFAFGLAVGNNSGPDLSVSIDNVSVTGNDTGIGAGGTTKVFLGRSVVTPNTRGVVNSTSPNTFYTYKDNRISGNTSSSDINGPLNATVVLQ